MSVCCADVTYLLQGIAYEWEYLVSTSFIDTALKNQINAACDWRAAEQNIEVYSS